MIDLHWRKLKFRFRKVAMGALDIVSLAILAILIVGALFLVLIVAAIPGMIAKNRRSPWVEGINVAGWIGVLLPPIWMLALIAAFVRPKTGEGAQITISQEETTELAGEIGKISERVTTLQNNIHDLNSRASGPSSGGLRPWSEASWLLCGFWCSEVWIRKGSWRTGRRLAS
jgi:hypothetical protein